MNPVIPLYTIAAVMLTLYSTGAAAGHWSGPLKQHTGLKPEAWFRVNQTIITHFYVIFTSLLPVMTVIMVLLLHIFTTLFRHYYELILFNKKIIKIFVVQILYRPVLPAHSALHEGNSRSFLLRSNSYF